MKEVIAMHGWSGDQTTWNLWAHEFQKFGWNWQSGERGYGNEKPKRPQWNSLSNTNSSNYRVFIGHSLGPHLIDQEVLSKSSHIILLCSFGKFLPKGQDHRSIGMALKEMKENIGTQGEKKMLNKFLSKACHPALKNALPPGPIEKGLSQRGRERLKNDLNLLINTEGIPFGIPSSAKVLIVDGQEDLIIPSNAKESLRNELIKHLNKKPTSWEIPKAGHALIVPKLIHDVLKWLDI